MADDTFDYCALPAETAAGLRDRRDRIRDLVVQTALTAVEIGKLLLQARERIGRRWYRRWVEREFLFNRSQATRLMRVAAVFGDASDLDRFSPSALFLL